MGHLQQLIKTLSVLPVGEAGARKAAELRITHYHHQTTPLSLTDCFLLGTAVSLKAAVATSDGATARVGRTEGLKVIALQNSLGHRP